MAHGDGFKSHYVLWKHRRDFSDKTNREIYSLCDGIIAGQGDGPLWPDPLPLGVISFTDNPAVNDIAMATIMGFDFRRFPLLTEATKLFPVNKTEIFINGSKSKLADLKEALRED